MNTIEIYGFPLDMGLCKRNMQILDEQLLSAPYIAGPELSLAGLFLFPMIAFVERLAPCEGEHPFKGLDAWLSALKARSGYMEVVSGGA